MRAIRERYGETCATAAGHRWVTVLETADWEPSDPAPDWRRITVVTLATLLTLRLLPVHAVEQA